MEIEIIINKDGTVLIPADLLENVSFRSFLLSETTDPKSIETFSEINTSEVIFGNNILCG